MAATEPLLPARCSMSQYNSASDTVQLLSSAVNMEAAAGDGGERKLSESQGLSSLEESLRRRSASSPTSTDDFFRVEASERGRGRERERERAVCKTAGWGRCLRVELGVAGLAGGATTCLPSAVARRPMSTACPRPGGSFSSGGETLAGFSLARSLSIIMWSVLHIHHKYTNTAL